MSSSEQRSAKSNRTTTKLLRRFGSLLTLVGILALGYYLFVSLETRVFQAYEGWQLDQISKSNSASFARRPAPTKRAQAQTVGGPAQHVATQGNISSRRAGGLFGRIQIPRINLSAVILEGDDAKTLRLAVGHIPGTARPGEPGCVALAGHRDTFFQHLGAVRENDSIIVSTLHGNYWYVVDSIKLVQPEDTSILDSGPRPTLTLVTCFPFDFIGSAPQRFIVRAHQIAALSNHSS